MSVAVPAKMITYRFFLRAYSPIKVIITSYRVFSLCTVLAQVKNYQFVASRTLGLVP